MGEFHVNGTAYTKNKKIENVTCVMEFHKIVEWMNKKNMIKLEKEYINRITDQQKEKKNKAIGEKEIANAQRKQ